MAQISIIKKSELEGATRLDAEYYQPKYFALIDKIKQSGLTIEMLGDLTTEKVHRGVLPEYTGTPEIPVLKTVNVRNDFIFLDSCSYTTRDFYDKNSRGVVKPTLSMKVAVTVLSLSRVSVVDGESGSAISSMSSVLQATNRQSGSAVAVISTTSFAG